MRLRVTLTPEATSMRLNLGCVLAVAAWLLVLVLAWALASILGGLLPR